MAVNRVSNRGHEYETNESTLISFSHLWCGENHIFEKCLFLIGRKYGPMRGMVMTSQRQPKLNWPTKVNKLKNESCFFDIASKVLWKIVIEIFFYFGSAGTSLKSTFFNENDFFMIWQKIAFFKCLFLKIWGLPVLGRIDRVASVLLIGLFLGCFKYVSFEYFYFGITF